MKKLLKYLLALALFLFVGYHSVYFKKLTAVKAETATEKTNTAQYTSTFWSQKLLPSLNKALSLNELISLLKANPEKAFSDYGKALGIGDLKYFMVKGTGKILKVGENDVTVTSTGAKENQVFHIATEYVYGNAVRDASGLLNMNEFDNTADFNEVSAGINQLIRTTVLPNFKQQATAGNQIEFIGAIELNKKFLDLSNIEITPVQLKILKQ